MKILCFSPNDAIWRWTFPQAQFLETLKQRGDTIDYLYCDRTFSSFCMSMASSGVSFDASKEAKGAICEKCIANSKLVRDSFGFDGYPAHKFLNDAERAEARELSQAATLDEMYRYEFDGISVGKFALYEAIIHTKSISLQLSEDSERLYRLVFENCVLTAFATRRALEQLKPDAGVTYHTAYSYNRVFQHLTEVRGIPLWFLNASFSVAELDTHLVAAKSDPEALFRKMLRDWDRFREVPSTPQALEAAADHLVGLMAGGGFAYSTALKSRGKTTLEQLGCPPGKKVILALLSSYDELFAADVAGFGWSTQSNVFADQVDWVRWLYQFASGRDDVHIIIRVHPREFPIRGKGPRSEHALLLEKVFAQHPNNVSINLPTDAIAVYELLVEADVALIAWSSAGMEAGMLGIPVVTWFGDALLFPRTLAFEAKTRAEYEATVERALASAWSFERARLFFRWAVLMFVRTRVDLTNGHAPSVRSSGAKRLVRRGFDFLRRRMTPWTDEKWAIKRRARHLEAAETIRALVDQQLPTFYEYQTQGPSKGVAEETAALARQLGAIAEFMRRGTGLRARRLEAMLAGTGKSQH